VVKPFEELTMSPGSQPLQGEADCTMRNSDCITAVGACKIKIV